MHPYFAYEIAVQMVEQQRRDAARARLARESRAVAAAPAQKREGLSLPRLRRYPRPATHGGC